MRHLLRLLIALAPAILMIGLRFSNPELTQPQFLIQYWHVIGLAFLASILGIIVVHEDEKRREP